MLIRILRKFQSRIYRLILLRWDPTVKIRVYDIDLFMNLSHNLPFFVKSSGCYDTALPRLASFIDRVDGHLHIIDVGSNIGDTVNFINRENKDAHYLCIDADKNYIPYFIENTSNIRNVIFECKFLAESEMNVEGELVSIYGTSYFNKASQKEILNSTSLDNLLRKYTEFNNCNILKVDTDGYDFKVLRGAKNLIKNKKPILFFEYAPYHLELSGEDLFSVFDLIKEFEYSHLIFYEDTGILFSSQNLDKDQGYKQVINYINIKRKYFDIVAFPEIRNHDYEIFLAEEKRAFNYM